MQPSVAGERRNLTLKYEALSDDGTELISNTVYLKKDWRLMSLYTLM